MCDDAHGIDHACAFQDLPPMPNLPNGTISGFAGIFYEGRWLTQDELILALAKGAERSAELQQGPRAHLLWPSR